MAVLWLAGLVALVACAAVGDAAMSPTPGNPATPATPGTGPVRTLGPSAWSPEIGAYYSDWFPTNSAQGTLRQHLVPPQGTDPTLVDSADPRVAERAIAQASKSGIDFFALDWWPSRPAQDRNVDAFVKARNLSDTKFCFLYETWDLGFQAGNETTPVTPSMELQFDEDLLLFADRYFSNPSYLRVGGRPVVVLYLSRTLTGDVSAMMAGARAVMKDHGFDPFFIGDEIAWRVDAVDTPANTLGLTPTPQVSRIDLFDAVTAYTLYSGGAPDPLSPQQDFEHYPGETSLVPDEVGLYRKYQLASGGRVPVVPDVMPGINTRGVRLQVNEPAQPRQWLPGDSPGSTLEHYLDQIAGPVLEPSLPMVFVTSWNEWNEDTAVQPVGGTATSRDDSPTGSAYTQGYTYGGEGNADLTVLRDFADAAWGRVVTTAGRPLAHARVVETAHGRAVNAVRTDSAGWYVLPRSGPCPATLSVVAAGRTRTFVCSLTRAQRVDVRA